MSVSFCVMDGKRDMAYEALRKFVMDRRTALGLSQRDLAKLAGISFGVIAKMESGPISIIPRQSSLEGLARGLQVPYEVLDRLARGRSIEPSPAGTPWRDEQDPEIAARMAEISQLTSDQKRVILAGLKAQIAAMQSTE